MWNFYVDNFLTHNNGDFCGVLKPQTLWDDSHTEVNSIKTYLQFDDTIFECAFDLHFANTHLIDQFGVVNTLQFTDLNLSVDLDFAGEFFDSCSNEEVSSQFRISDFENYFRHNSPNLMGIDEVKSFIAKKQHQYAMEKVCAKIDNGFSPQLGSEALSLVKLFFGSMAKRACKEYSEDFLRHVRYALDFLYIVIYSKDMVCVYCALDMYLACIGRSGLLELLKDFISKDMTPHSGDENNKTWAHMVENMRTNWSKVKHNPFFNHVSKMLGVLAALEICRAQDVEFSVKGLKVVGPSLRVQQGDAFDLIEAVLETVDYMIRTYNLCVEDSSLMPLLLDEQESATMDVEYALLVSLWPLVQNGNLEREKNMEEEEFNRRLNELCRKLKALLPSLKGVEKSVVESKYINVMKLLNDYSILRTSTGIKESSFVLSYNGGTNRGKSIVCDLMTHILLESQDLPTDNKYKWTYNGNDKYQSGVDSTKIVALLDDFANAKPQHGTGNPCQTLIEIANPTGYTPNMASLHEKGRISPRFQLINITTNKKDLAAYQYSVCPSSIQRRAHFTITVEVKKEFATFDKDGKITGIDATKVRESFADKDFDDCWLFTIETVGAVEDLSHVAPYIVAKNDAGKKMKNVGWVDMRDFIVAKFAEHRKNQKNVMCRVKDVKERISKKRQLEREKEKEVEMVPHFGREIAWAIYDSEYKIMSLLSEKFLGLEQVVSDAATDAIFAATRTFTKHWDWMWFVPTPWIDNIYFQQLMFFLYRKQIARRFAIHTTFLWCLFMPVISVMIWYALPVWIIVFTVLFCISVQKHFVESVKENFRQELIDRATLTDTLQNLKNDHANTVIAASALLFFLYGLSKVYKEYLSINASANLIPQGSLTPKSIDEVEKRDKEVNDWVQVHREPLPLQNSAKGSTPAHLARLIDVNLVYASVDVGNEVMACNFLFLDTGVIVIPQHYFVLNGYDDLRAVCRKRHPDASAGKFVLNLGFSNAYFVPDSDIAIVAVTGGGDFNNLTKYLPTTKQFSDFDFDFTRRSKDGVIHRAKGLGRCMNTGHYLKKFFGIYYKSITANMESGYCGSVLTSRHKSLIMGFHVGGQDGKPIGCACSITSDDMLTFREVQSNSPDVLNAGSSSEFVPSSLGVNFALAGDIHSKSPVRYLPNGSQIQWIGNCIGHSTFKSDFQVTPISEHVMDVMDMPNEFCAPVESPQWEGWQKCLANLALPAEPFPTSLLHKAINDYCEPMDALFLDPMWNDIAPLTDLENMNGIPGKKFMDRIKLNTAIGYPLTGKKSDRVIELEPIGPYTKIVEFDDAIKEEIVRMETCYKQGMRAYTIAKACKKDEILDKRKNRIFYANSAGLTYLIRKYFLPIIRVMQMNPLLSECAVGVNSHGPEWEQIHQFFHEYGEDRIFGGDYSKYDQKLPSQLLTAAFKILIRFAKLLPNYTEEDIAIMEAMTADVVYAIIAFNGDLIRLISGGHISGNSLTVILNGICGSLNLRCCFFDKFSHDMKFRDWVNLLTYGDDNGGSVRPGIEFGTLTISNFLQKYGQTYTRPDKKEATSEFLEPEVFDFIKRKSVFIPELGVHVGALDEKSCSKMLHCFLRNSKSPLSEEMACAENIQTAAREWFNHGRDKYDFRVAQLKEVARRADILHLCPELNLTFDDRVEHWKDRYL